MASVNLSFPAGSDFDFSVARTGAVSDDEVIGQTILHSSLFSVETVKAGGISYGGSGVVGDDFPPAFAVDFFVSNFPAQCLREAGGDLEFLAGVNGIGGEVVLPFEVGDGDAEFFGDFPERVAFFDAVNAFRGGEVGVVGAI